jgi:hypothetical protein
LQEDTEDDEDTEEAEASSLRVCRLAALASADLRAQWASAVDTELRDVACVLFFDETELGSLAELAAAVGADPRLRGLLICVLAGRRQLGDVGPLGFLGHSTGILNTLASRVATVERALEVAHLADRQVRDLLVIAEYERQMAVPLARVSLSHRRGRDTAR